MNDTHNHKVIWDILRISSELDKLKSVPIPIIDEWVETYPGLRDAFYSIDLAIAGIPYLNKTATVKDNHPLPYRGHTFPIIRVAYIRKTDDGFKIELALSTKGTPFEDQSPVITVPVRWLIINEE